MANLEFRIRGMNCAEEVDILKRELGPLVGGEPSHLPLAAWEDGGRERFRYSR